MHTSHARPQDSSNLGGENVKRNMICFDPEISMNYASKVDKYFTVENNAAGDFNGNFKLRQGDLQMISDRKLSRSDPQLLNSNTRHVTRTGATCQNLWEYQVIHPEQLLKRQATWHHNSDQLSEHERVVQIVEDVEDNLLVDQITSTV